MAHYLDIADDLRKEVEAFIAGMHKDYTEPELTSIAVKLGYIINLAVRCNPRQPQGTVRKNIVAKAMEKYCKVWMTKEVDEITGRDYNLIHIKALD